VHTDPTPALDTPFGFSKAPTVLIETTLASRFADTFSVIPANSAELREEVYRLRHQVYCDELGYEPRRASRLEHDAYDARSIHCLLFHKASQSFAGCVRLVLPDGNDEDEQLPFEGSCSQSLEWDFDAAGQTPRTRYGEISRLAITANFRRRRSEAASDDDATDALDSAADSDRRLFPSVALGLYVAITAMGLNRGLDGVFAMMEPRLARQLRRFGIVFTQVGAQVEHRGVRAPFFIHRDGLFDNLKTDCRVLLAHIQKQLQFAKQFEVA
jgi:N-acyl amino acid synthase of PEP-CTERM/exosortase system